jgi:hypothetical protein
VRDTVSPLLFHHSSRVFYFAALAGRRRGLRFDPELLYCGCMFHDMGLSHKHSSACERFEVDGANADRDFLDSRGIRKNDIDTVWNAIALHTTPGIPQHMHPVVALVTAGVEMDVLGMKYEEYSDAEREALGAPARRQFQGRHHPDLLQRHPPQTRHHFRQRQGRRDRRQGTGVCTRQFLQRDPRLGLEGLTRLSRSIVRRQRRDDTAESRHRQRLVLFVAVVAELDDDGVADRIDVDVLAMDADRGVVARRAAAVAGGGLAR